MKKFRIVTAIVLACIMALAALPALAEKGEAAEPRDVNGNTFSNDYIAFNVNNYGGVSWYENAEGRDLLYDRTSSTSYTTIRVNGTSYKYDGVTKTVAPAFQGETNYSAANVNGIVVEQKLTPVENDLGHKSIVEWHYIYTNTTNEPQSVGCRIMLDTCLGGTEGDGAPYRVPGQDAITSEMMFYGDDIPDYWFTYFTKAAGWFSEGYSITAQGTFHEGYMPNQFQISQWTNIYDVAWNYQNTYYSSMSDTSCAATWYEETLNPGESREYYMYYGIGELQQIQTGELQLTLNGNHSVDINAEGTGYEPNPVSIMSILENVGNGTLHNAYVQYGELPEGLSFAQPTTTSGESAVFPADDEFQFTTYIMIDSTSTEDRTFMIPVHYGCDEQEDTIAYFELFVPGIEPIPEPDPVPPVIYTEAAELRTRATSDNYKDLRFIFGVTFNDASVEYKGKTYGPGEIFDITRFYSELTVGTKKTVTVEGTNIYAMYDDSYQFTAVVKGIRPVNFDSDITAYGFLEYVNKLNGEAGTDNTLDEEFVYCVNDFIN